METVLLQHDGSQTCQPVRDTPARRCSQVGLIAPRSSILHRGIADVYESTWGNVGLALKSVDRVVYILMVFSNLPRNAVGMALPLSRNCVIRLIRSVKKTYRVLRSLQSYLATESF